ncbi:hypothetical protein [Lewinella cohaerens]|uniref:hypothetical protein n=1 Tax=Lewinella cohaerens TaxID=70995 RepID=UPI00035C2176|nr:hypothetical protein [Lewinella cohaerens]
MKKSNLIVDFFKEITIVVIGVLIAVSIGNYKEKLDNEKYLKKTLLAIKSEIISSQREIDTVLERHLKLYEKLENGFVENEQTIGEFVSNSGGFQVASVKNISLRFFVSNKAELLEFELISQLLDIELKTTLLTNKMERFADFAYENVNENDEQVMMKFAYLLVDVIDGEQTLLESYSDLLDENKKYLSSRIK